MIQPTVWIPDEVALSLEREAVRKFPSETGGVLLGFVDPDDIGAIQVLSDVGPGPNAVHLAHRFEPDSGWQAEKIAAEYRHSGRIATYLGDWHSHPLGGARPSRLDRKTARAIARCRSARITNPLMLLLAGGPDAWHLAAYRYRRRRLRPLAVRRE